MRRLLLLAVALLPAATALSTVRPVQAASHEAFGSFGLTVTAAALRTEGVVGASGGLVTLDAGAAFTTGRLDSGPSSYALGAPVEPGTLGRTLVGTVNTEAGTTVLTVPDAEAAYPGRGTASTEYAPAQTVGPLTVAPGRASSSATADRATATTSNSGLVLAGVVDGDGLSASSTLTGTAATGTGDVVGSSRVDSLDVAGVLALEDVVATARVVITGGTPVTTAQLTVGSATVAGVPVTIDEEGVHAAGQGTGLGPVQDAQDQVEQALAAAGVSARAVGVTRTVEGRTGYADTGGLRITLRTPDLPGGVAANALTVTVGKVTATGTSTEALDVPVVTVPPVVETPGVPPTTSTVTVTTGATGPLPGAPAPTAPTPALAAGESRALVAGHAVPAVAALAAFGLWQLLTLSTTTLYAVVDRRRRSDELAEEPA